MTDCPPCKVFGFDPRVHRFVVGNVSVSANRVLSFVLKEECPEMQNIRNTFLVFVQGLEMNGITRVEKVRISRGVYLFNVDLSPIEPILLNGSNTVEVQSTGNMLVCGSGFFDGMFYLSCGQLELSVHSNCSIFISPGPKIPSIVVGMYERFNDGSGKIIYLKKSDSSVAVMFIRDRWFVVILNPSGTVRQILYSQWSIGNPEMVDLDDWIHYRESGVAPQSGKISIKTAIPMTSCIGFSSNLANIILVNCGGLDIANGSYVKSGLQFVNIRDRNLVITYIQTSGTEAFWQIQDVRSVSCGEDPVIMYSSPMIVSTTIYDSCIPCCQWSKASTNSPGDPPTVSALEYFDPLNPTHVIRFADTNESNWMIFDRTTPVAVGTSDNYIVSGSADVDGVFCLTCLTTLNVPDYTRILDMSIIMGFNSVNKRWEIRKQTSTSTEEVLFYSPSTNPSSPPSTGWMTSSNATCDLVVISSVVPSSVTWSPI